jgi:spermidine synthase
MPANSKIPRWKYLLSHLVDLPVDAGGTEYNPSLELSLSKGRFYLSTPNAVYSYGDLYRNFFNTFKRLKLSAMPEQEVLLLGLGMGSIPFMLEKKFGRKYRYTAVELDEVIAGWAMQYSLPQLSSPIIIYTADAYQFVMSTSQKFDLIAVDVFLDEMVPDIFDEADFAARLKEILREDGLIIWNRLAGESKFRQRTETYFSDIFKPVFPEAVYLKMEVNRMLLNHGRTLK